MKKQRIAAIVLALALLTGSLALAAAGSPKALRNDRPSASTGGIPSGGVTRRDDLADQVVRLVNARRVEQGLNPLRVDAELTRAARVRAWELLRVFSHARPDGSNWSTVSPSAYGENIARGQKTAEKAMAAWMTSSSGHRENILRAGYGSIGVCALNDHGVVYWVQIFGK